MSSLTAIHHRLHTGFGMTRCHPSVVRCMHNSWRAVTAVVGGGLLVLVAAAKYSLTSMSVFQP